jgi:hypothetical protein
MCAQPTYLPWTGLLHKIALSDTFIVMDNVAFSRKGWQNRNRIKGGSGPFWLTVPLSAPSKREHRLSELTIAGAFDGPDRSWQVRHWNSLRLAYARAPYWRRYAPLFEDIYRGYTWTGIVEFNLALLGRLLAAFDLHTEIVLASRMGHTGKGSNLVLDLCRSAGASVYVSGVHGHDYLSEEDFLARNIAVFYQRYRPPVYRQRFGEFVPNLSAVDLLFNAGPEGTRLLLEGNVTRRTIVDALAATGPAILETRVDGSQVTDRSARVEVGR